MYLMPINRNHILQRIKQHRLIAIVRFNNQQDVAQSIDCLVKGGVEILEITANTPGFLTEIENARANYPDILVGAGTITNQVLAVRAIEAGAQFLVTPNISKDVIDIAHKSECPVVMGALTPTEIAYASDAGADIIKLFPAEAMGVGYLQGIKAPFDNLTFFAVGGISADNLANWFEAGIDGVGVGSELTKAVYNEHEIAEHIEFIKGFINGLNHSVNAKVNNQPSSQ